MRAMSPFRRSIGSHLFNVARASQLCIFTLSKSLRHGVIGSTGLRRMANLEKQMCRQLAMLIALCLMFSLVPVAGKKIAAKDFESQVILHSSILHGQIPPRDFTADATVENIRTSALIHWRRALSAMPDCTHSRSACRSMQVNIPKPDVDDPGISTKQSQGIDGIERIGDCSASGPVAKKGVKFSATKLLSVKKGIQGMLSYGYMRLKCHLQNMEEVKETRGTGFMKGRNLASHGLIRSRPVGLLEAFGEEHYWPGLADHMGKDSDKNGGLTGWHGMSRAKKHSGAKLPRSLIRETKQKEQIQKVVDTLRKSGLFAAIARIIETMNWWTLPQFVTIFTPTDSAYQTVKEADIDQLELFQYHAVIQRYPFNLLCQFSEGTILYTLRPGYSIVVTGNKSPYKITLDDVSVIAPDLYVDDSIAVHGIDGIFNATLYGRNLGGRVPELAAPPPANVASKPAPLASPPAKDPGSNNGSINAAGAAQPSSPSQPGVNLANDPNSSLSPLASEIASDVDSSDLTVSGSFEACCSAVFLCIFSILCC